MSFKKTISLTLICLLLIITRFSKLDWGQGNFFHPDENNMATAITRLSPNNLNPHFFAYGQFPLYLAYFSARIIHPTVDFAAAIFSLRFWSAVFSLPYLLLLLLISRRLLLRQSGFLIGLLIFTPGLIQLAHFGTTESLLNLVFVALIFFSLLILHRPSLPLVIIAALVSGLGLATKITSLLFICPILLALFFDLINHRQPLSFIKLTLTFLLITAVSFVILSPYNWLAFSDFRSAINYEVSVATGSTKVFYTNQFLSSAPYFFQLTKIFPHTNGLPVLILGILGALVLVSSFRHFPPRLRQSWLIVLLPSLIYFLYQGQLYTKWTRFMSPLFFIWPLLASYLIERISAPFRFVLFFISVIPGFLFFLIYLQPDNRLVASRWIENHLPANASILSEAGNVLNLPISPQPYQVSNFDFYNLDQNPALPPQLANLISQNNYILIPSRRIFKNQSNPLFPYSNRYYQSLFSGKLGFQSIYQTPAFPLYDEGAEETWSVFDHPIVRVYEKMKTPNQSTN